jgi:hypothetical protein
MKQPRQIIFYCDRFPRVEEIRDDKNWSDCMTFKELKDLLQLTGGSLTRATKGNEFHVSN